jgi:dihydrofolate reductase
MPQIIYHVATSLDGFIADKDHGVDWLNDFEGMKDSQAMADFSKLMQSFDAILLGGKTYDFTLDYGQWMSPGIPTWVFTGRDLKLLDPCIQLTRQSPTEICDELDRRNLERVWLMGGGKLAASFHNAGLIQEIDLAIVPILLGQGISLIGKTSRDPQLRLTKSKSYQSGFVHSTYGVINPEPGLV